MAISVEVELITSATAANAMGDPVPVETSRKVMADKFSVRQGEFYQAAANGLKLEAMFVVATVEYQGELHLACEGKRYKIARTYDRPDERTELICTGLVNTAG